MGTVSQGSKGKLLDKYTLGKVLGQGAFGIVYSCKSKETKDEFAVKMIDKVETPLAEIRHEAEMLEKLKHFSVVELHDTYYEKAFVCMVMTIYKGGDMIEGMQLHWKNLGMLPMPVVANVSKQMIESIAWLHHHSIVHRDVKGDNYLMDRKELEHAECRIYLSDFGTVREVREGIRINSKCGTKTYWAPEFFQFNYGLKVDVWALGVIMYGLVTGRFPFKGEDDVNHKKINIPTRASQDCGKLLLGLLERNEAARLTARQALDHAFCKAAVTPHKPLESPEPMQGEITREVVNNYQLDRRCNIVRAMQDAEDSRLKTTALQLRSAGSEGAPMEVLHHQGRKSRFQWFDMAKATQHGLHDTTGAVAWVDDSQKNAKSVKRVTERMLKDHKIESSKFGVGEAKSFDEFLLEIQTGAAAILIDASKHKTDQLCIVRVVDLVLIRIEAKAPNGVKQYLIKTSEKYPDGRERSGINQLPGTKKEPHENAVETLQRVVKERLNLETCQIRVDFTKKETYEEDTSSPSFPGIRTVYRAEIFEGTITNTDTALLNKVGVLNGGTFGTTDPKGYVRTYQWMTESECMRKNIKLKIGETKDFSALVHAPVSPNEDEIKSLLKENGVNWDIWEPEKFQILTDELAKGESALVKADEKLLRVVDIVVVKVMKEESVLAETEEEDSTGKTTTLNWLPAVKRRPDENMFLAAKRCVTKHMWIDENAVIFNTTSVMIAEEEKESQTFPGLKSLYRKRIITANVVADESNIILS